MCTRPEKYNERQREYKRARPELERAGHLRRKFGLTQDKFDTLSAVQSGTRAICGREPRPGKYLHVDHDHDTREVRGLLCFSCNVGIGNFGHDEERMQRALDYLETRPVERLELDEVARERARALVGVA